MFSDKKILFFGAGAVGSFYGGLLTSKGYDVTLVTRGEHLKSLQNKGLTLHSNIYGNKNIKVKAKEIPDEVYDFIFITVKSFDTENACKILQKHVHKDSIFISFQNGIENHEIIGNFFGKNNVVPATIFIGVSVEKPGHVKHMAHGKITLGYLNDKSKQKAELVYNLLKQADFEVSLDNNIKLAMWKKLIWNAAFNPLSVVFETTCGRLVKNKNSLSIMKDIIKECAETAKADGIIIPEDYLEKVLIVDNSLKDYKTSMLLDIQKGKTPEIDGILGTIVRKAQKFGIKAQTCKTVLNIILAKYGKSFIYTPKLTVDVIAYKNDELLLIERHNPPHGWALPGGFVDYGEKTEIAASRELFEETSILETNLNLLGVYSDPSRDSRMHTVSVVYYTKTNQLPKPGDDAKNTKFFKFNNLPDNIAFDHKQIIEDFFKKIINSRSSI